MSGPSSKITPACSVAVRLACSVAIKTAFDGPRRLPGLSWGLDDLTLADSSMTGMADGGAALGNV